MITFEYVKQGHRIVPHHCKDGETFNCNFMEWEPCRHCKEKEE